VKALWVLGEPPVDPASLAGVECLIVQAIRPSALTERADIVLPGTAFAEKSGTVTNLERRVQRLTAAKLAPGLAREDWRILIEAARALGAGYDYPSPREVLREIARDCPRYAGITWERAARQGQQWAADAPARPEAAAAD